LQSEIEKKYKKFVNNNIIEDDNIAKLQNLFDEYRITHAEIEKIYEKSLKAKKHTKGWMFFLFVVSWATAFILFMQEIVYLEISILISIIPIPILILIIIISKKTRKNTYLDELIEKKSKIKSELEKLLMIKNIAEYDCHFEGLFQILLRHFDDFGEYSDKKSEIKGIAADMNSDEDIDKIRKKLNQSKKKRRGLSQSILTELDKNFRVSAKEFDENLITELISKNDGEIKSVKEKIAEKKEILANVISEIKDERDYSQEIEAMDAEIAEAKKDLQVLIEKKDTLYSVIESLSDAVANISKKKYKKILGESLICFQLLTNGIYNQIDEKTIDSLIKNQDEYNELSDEVKYCILLSVKLKLTDFLSKNIPLIIEELKNAFSIINGDFLKSEIDAIGKQRQVILFINDGSLFESENIAVYEH